MAPIDAAMLLFCGEHGVLRRRLLPAEHDDASLPPVKQPDRIRRGRGVDYREAAPAVCLFSSDAARAAGRLITAHAWRPRQAKTKTDRDVWLSSRPVCLVDLLCIVYIPRRLWNLSRGCSRLVAMGDRLWHTGRRVGHCR